jgi:hypothetical protein
MSEKNKDNTAGLLLAIIAGAVLLVAAGFIAFQQNYSHKISSIEITTSTGPVAPEFQQQKTIVITKDSCEIKVTNVASPQTSSQNCQPAENRFKDLQKTADEYALIDKIIADNNSSTTLLGGSTYSIKITLNNGDSFLTKGGVDFQQSIEPFTKQLELYYPKISN